MKLIDQGLTPLTSSEIRVALVPVGRVPDEVLRDYQSMIEKYRHVRNNLSSLKCSRTEGIKDLGVGLASVRSFHHEKQKSPFKHLPWNKGCLNFRFLSGATLQPAALSCLYANRAILGVIGVCHCPSSPDIPKAYSEFETICKQFPNSVTLRCFAFDPLSDDMSASSKQKEHLIMFPKCDRIQLEQNVEVLMHDFAACLLIELQQGMLNLSVGMMSLSSIIDQPDIFGYTGTTEDISKRLGTEDEVKIRRRHTRMQKLFGDWSMLAGSPRDAFEHYNTCLELSRYCGDIIWGAAAIEGMAEAKILEALIEKDATPKLATDVFQQSTNALSAEDEASSSSLESDMDSPYEDPNIGYGHKKMWSAIRTIPDLLNQVLAFYNEAETVYYRKEILPLQIEVEMKTVRLLIAVEGTNALPRINNVLSRVLEQWINLKTELDRISLVIEVSRILQSMGLNRKRALLLWQALDSPHALQTTDRELLSLVLTSDPNRDLTEIQKEIKYLTKDVLRTPNWQPLKMAMVDALFSVASRAGMDIILWEASATLLREFFNVIAQDRQQILMDLMKKASTQMSPGDKRRDSLGPPPYFQVRDICHLPDPLKPRICDELKDQSANKESQETPFIFNPYAMKRRSDARSEREEQSRWIVGEECSLEVYISNPCAVQLKIERLCLCVETPDGQSPSADPVSVAVVLPPRTKPTRVSLTLVPNVAGLLRVIGCHVTLFGVTWLQRFVTSLRRVPRVANVLNVESEWGSENNVIVELDVLPSMPLLRWQFLKIDSDQTWPATLEEITKTQTSNQQEKEKILDVFVRAGEELNFKLKLTNVSKLTINRACLFSDQKMRSSQDSPEYLSLTVDQHFITEKLPLLPGDFIEVPVKVQVHQIVPTNAIPYKIKMRYGGPQEDLNVGVFGRELTASLMFKILPSVNIINIQITEQNVPVGQKLVRQKSSLNGTESSRLNNSAFNGTSLKTSSSNVTSELDVTSTEHRTVLRSKNSTDSIQQNSVSTKDQDEVFQFRNECVLKLTISNQDNQLLCVWVGNSQPDKTPSLQWTVPPAPDSHSVVPSQAAQVSCIIPKMEITPSGHPVPDLESTAVDWINSSLSSYWQSPVHQSSYPDKDDGMDSSFTLAPIYGCQGMIRLKKDQLMCVLEPVLLSSIIRGTVILSIQLTEPYTRGFTNLKTQFPSQGDHLGGLIDPRLINESLDEWTIQTPEFDPGSANHVLESTSSAQTDLPSTPCGPNGEIWGIELEVGEFLNCKFIVQNESEQGLVQLPISIITERIDEIGETSEVLYRREGGLNDTGILLIGPVSNFPITCPANSTFQHK
eukprot:g1727.t1